MRTELVAQLKRYPSAVLTVIDGAGYPLSIRCHPQVDGDTQILRLVLASQIDELRAGPASILCHAHDEELWHLMTVLVRGTVECPSNANGTCIFHPLRLIRGQSRSPVYFLHTLVTGRRAARRYLALRGIPRPQIPWQHILEARAGGASTSEWNVAATNGKGKGHDGAG